MASPLCNLSSWCLIFPVGWPDSDSAARQVRITAAGLGFSVHLGPIPHVLVATSAHLGTVPHVLVATNAHLGAVPHVLVATNAHWLQFSWLRTESNSTVCFLNVGLKYLIIYVAMVACYRSLKFLLSSIYLF